MIKFYKHKNGYWVKTLTYKIHKKQVTRNFIYWDIGQLKNSIKKNIENGYKLC